ncbi:MAG: hypothetical protein COB76_06775 [Alphaproteobacteria bacterium]|nr:MAG: hypothetical protein COB76_06775 [Alphaproteobacteria bacterium]
MFSFLKKNRNYDNPEFLDQVEILKARGEDPIAKIALNNLKKTEMMIDHAGKGQEIIITDMYEANRIPLEMLNKGDAFLGISAIINPLDWAHDEELQKYKDTNAAQAKKGVDIERTFVLQSPRDIDSMRAIMDEQSAMGISVRYVLEDDLKSLSYFPDFTIMPSLNLVIYVPNLNNLTTCIATCDADLMSELMKDYETVQKYATTWNCNE